MPGKLTVVPTPIGNLGDITDRAREALRAADVVYCEDTRRSGLLLRRLGIERPLRSLFVGNERERSAEALAQIAEGKEIALVSDAGTPGVSDPGGALVQAVIEAGYGLEVLPGAQAILPALLLSGLPAVPFTFAGFLPRKAGERRTALEALSTLASTLVLYEAPHRLRTMLADAAAVLGNRPAAVVREISKLHEEVIRGDLPTLSDIFSAREARGEIVVVIGGRTPQEAPCQSVEEFVRTGRENGLTPRQIADAARSAGLRRRDVYHEALKRGRPEN